MTGDPATGLQVPPNCDLTLGLVCVEKGAGRTVWEMRAHERFANPNGVVQGGIVAAWCDSAMGATVITAAAGRRIRVTNTDLRASFLRPVAVGALLRCEATIVSGGRRVAFTEATVAAADGTSLARASGTYLLLERR